jgi:hypothetical protein
MASGGSTGRPKLIVAKVPAEFDPETPAVQMQPGDVQLVPGPLFHHGPYSFSMFDLFVGGTLVVMAGTTAPDQALPGWTGPSTDRFQLPLSGDGRTLLIYRKESG